MVETDLYQVVSGRHSNSSKALSIVAKHAQPKTFDHLLNYALSIQSTETFKSPEHIGTSEIVATPEDLQLSSGSSCLTSHPLWTPEPPQVDVYVFTRSPLSAVLSLKWLPIIRWFNGLVNASIAGEKIIEGQVNV